MIGICDQGSRGASGFLVENPIASAEHMPHSLYICVDTRRIRRQVARQGHEMRRSGVRGRNMRYDYASMGFYTFDCLGWPVSAIPPNGETYFIKDITLAVSGAAGTAV